jgi:signal transduction histidine kinase
LKYLNTLFFIVASSFILTCCSKKDVNKKSESTSDSITYYLDWGKNSNKTPKEKLRYSNKALGILKNQKNDSICREKIYEVANTFFSLQDWEGFKSASQLGLEKSLKSRDTLNIAKGYRYVAQYYNSTNVVDSAYIFYSKAEKLYTALNDEFNVGKVLLKKGILQFYTNDYLGAEISISHAYTRLKNSDDTQTIYQAISMIAIIANEMKDYQKAIEKHEEALNMVRQHNLRNSSQEATSLNNIGNVYQNLNRNRDAVDNFNRALEDTDLPLVNPDLYAVLLDNLAYSKFKLGDDQNLPNLFYKSLKIRDSINNRSGVILSKIHLSEYYADRKDTLASQKFALEASSTARISGAPSDILASLKQLSAVDHKNSSKYTKEYIRINDSLQQAERNSQNMLTRIQLETDEILQEKDQLEEQNRTLLYFFVGSLMIGVLLFVIRAQRSKNRELLLKQAQQKANEEIYNLMITQQNKIEEGRIREKKRIAQELHDGVLGRLFGARLNLDSLNKNSTQEAITKRNSYLSELKNIEQDIREISHDLNREKYVLINNFVAILNNLLEEQKLSFSTDFNVLIDETIKWDFLSNTFKINLYRIIQESLQNVNKYAKASHVSLKIIRSGESITLAVIDDGVGFSVDTKKKGIGLSNMISRAHELNATFEVRSKKGKGTTILISFPFENKQIISTENDTEAIIG